MTEATQMSAIKECIEVFTKHDPNCSGQELACACGLSQMREAALSEYEDLAAPAPTTEAPRELENVPSWFQWMWLQCHHHLDLDSIVAAPARNVASSEPSDSEVMRDKYQNFGPRAKEITNEICDHLKLPYGWPDSRFYWLQSRIESAMMEIFKSERAAKPGDV